MPTYSVAETKDKLSALIDKALAGEEVVITRRGKPTVELRATDRHVVDVRAATERLRKKIDGLEPLVIPTRNFRAWLYEDEDY